MMMTTKVDSQLAVVSAQLVAGVAQAESRPRFKLRGAAQRRTPGRPTALALHSLYLLPTP
eukprot:3604049-Rhodomonas_salina.2